VAAAARAVRQADPDAEIVLTPGDLLPHRMTWIGEEADLGGPTGWARRVLDDCGDAVDALGLVVDWPGCDLVQLFAAVDLLVRAGRPVHLLSAGAPSGWGDDPLAAPPPGVATREDHMRSLGCWRRPWSPQVQAAWAAGLALMAEAHPGVAALEWAHLRDDRPHRMPHGGLLDAAGEPKPLWHLLARGDAPGDAASLRRQRLHDAYRAVAVGGHDAAALAADALASLRPARPAGEARP
jgi:hypothetical protein